MNVKELRQALADFPDEAEVRIEDAPRLLAHVASVRMGIEMRRGKTTFYAAIEATAESARQAIDCPSRRLPTF